MMETLNKTCYQRYVNALVHSSEEHSEFSHPVYKKLLKKAHTNEVANALLTRDQNKVLKSGAHELHIHKLKLLRKQNET